MKESSKMFILAFNTTQEDVNKLMQGIILPINDYVVDSELNSKLKNKADRGEKFIIHAKETDDIPEDLAARGVKIEIQ